MVALSSYLVTPGYSVLNTSQIHREQLVMEEMMGSEMGELQGVVGNVAH